MTFSCLSIILFWEVISLRNEHQSIRLRYFWSGMYADIATYVKTCVACQKAKRVIHPGHPTITPMPITENTVFTILGPLTPSQDGHKYILLFVCAFSKWVEMVPLKDTTATTTAWHLYERIISRYGGPDHLLSDRGQNFLSKVVTEVC